MITNPETKEESIEVAEKKIGPNLVAFLKINTIMEVEQTLRGLHSWLRTDATYSRSNARCNVLKDQCEKLLKSIRIELEELNKPNK